jgi:tetrapyrrole methylase family protein/MazG family protein
MRSVGNKLAPITVIGLGPGMPGHLTVDAKARLEDAASKNALVLRTRIHPTVSAIDWLRDAPSFDHIYDGATDFESVYESIVAELIERAGRGPVTYAVPGHPTIGESTVSRLRARAMTAGFTLDIVPGVSFVDVIAPLVDVDLGDGVRIADALALGQIDPTVPLLICQVHSRRVAASVKLELARHYPDEHPITVIRAAGVPGEARVSTVPLWQLDRRDDVNHLTSLWVPALSVLEATREPAALLEVMSRLRSPDGCPWDREQTHASLRRFLLEETYEALEALDSGDVFALEEELGDLLLQIVFHAQIGAEEGTFTFSDVVAAITGKMIRRHPHVFGEASVTTTDQVLANWEATKQIEREARTHADSPRRSMLDGVPKTLPALAQSQAVQERAARVGFDWPDVQGVLEKLVEEAREVAEAPPDAIGDELGDVLFVTVNLARHLGVDAEEALRGATAKFRRRFGHVEQAVADRGLQWASLDLPFLDTLWNEAKVATDPS